MNPPNPNDDASALETTAARWAERRRIGLSAEERRTLLGWLAADPRHAAVFRAHDVARDELDWALHAGVTDVVMAGLARRAGRRTQRRTVLACAAMAMLAFGGAWWWGMPATPKTEAERASFVVVEPRRQVLSDGTVAELRGDAQISVEFEERARFVTLRSGVVHFEVASNSQRPFVVRVGDIAVRAVGTAFAVESGTDGVNVVVTHGRVALDTNIAASGLGSEVSTRAPLALVSAGNSVRLEKAPRAEAGGDSVSVAPSPAVVRASTPEDMELAVGWRKPRLEFSGTPLADVVGAMNRYNAVQFAIADAALAGLRLSGALRADKVDALVEILEADFSIRVERRGEREILLRRR